MPSACSISLFFLQKGYLPLHHNCFITPGHELTEQIKNFITFLFLKLLI